MAQQHDAINLSQGFPDFDGPEALRERVAYHMAHGHNQYAPLAGVPELRELIADKVLDLSSISAPIHQCNTPLQISCVTVHNITINWVISTSKNGICSAI